MADTKQPLRAVSLWQPWATMIAVGEKRIETRTWKAPQTGWLAIHAAKTRKGLDQIAEPFDDTYGHEEFYHPFDEIYARHGWHFRTDGMPLGAFVAVAWCNGSGPADQVLEHLRAEGLAPPHDRQLGGYGPGRIGWLLSSVVALPEPVPAKGQQGVWTPDATTVRAIREQWARAREAVPS